VFLISICVAVCPSLCHACIFRVDFVQLFWNCLTRILFCCMMLVAYNLCSVCVTSREVTYGGKLNIWRGYLFCNFGRVHIHTPGQNYQYWYY
jgi:hypothetical protein